MVVPLLSMEDQRALGFYNKNYFICVNFLSVPKMNEGLTGLEHHEGEY